MHVVRAKRALQYTASKLENPPHRLIWGGYATVALLSLWLRAGLPVSALGASALDDALFLRLAQSLASGEWLGPFDNGTLAKGMFYPLFAALAFLASIPLKIAEQLAYLGVCAGLAAYVSRQMRQPLSGLVLFTALALNPLMWLPFMARVVREGLYVSLSLLLLGLCAATLFQPDSAPERRRLVLAGCTGLAAGCFWLTREEGPWIIPAIAAMVAVWAIAGAGAWRVRLRSLAATIWPAFAVFLLALGCVMVANKAHYGVFETNEFHSRSFQRGYGALARIRHSQWQRYVVLPAQARQQAYAHSAAARELQPYFEGEAGEQWHSMGCEQTRTTPCPEILSGWFMWALRGAVAQAGHYGSGKDALQFYDRLADEIDAACAAGALDCLPQRSTLAPPFRWHYLADMAAPARILVPFVFTMGESSVGVADSAGSPEQLAFFGGMTGGTLAPVPTSLLISAWVASRSAVLEISVHDAAGQPVIGKMEYLPAPDVNTAHPGLVARRFRMPVDCDPRNCVLRIRTAQERVDAPLRQGSTQSASGNLIAHIDSLSLEPVLPIAQKRQRLQQGSARAIARAYAAVFPWLTIAAAFGVLLALSAKATRERHAPLIALAIGCFVAVLTRIALLAYLDVTSIPSANGSYATPVSALLVVFVVVGFWLGLTSLAARRNKST